MKLKPTLFLLFILVLNAAISSAQAPNISYAGPQTYTFGTAISPLSPTNTGGAVPPPITTTIASGLQGVINATIDAAGNVYVAETDYGIVNKYPAGGGAPVAIGRGFVHPTGIAVDSSGNVYVADSKKNLIRKITPANDLITIATGLNNPQGLAVDGMGNVFVCDSYNNTVKKIPAGGGSPINVGPSIQYLTDIAVDATGNIYIIASGVLMELPIGGGGVITLANQVATGLVVDSAGNIYYVTHTQTGFTTLKMPAGGGVPRTIITNTGFARLNAVDATGGLYVVTGDAIAGEYLNKITINGGYSIDNDLPPGLVFDLATGIISGTPTFIGPATDYTITAHNADGASQATVNITVNLPQKPNISYSGPNVYDAGTAIPPLSPSNTGAAVGMVSFPSVINSTYFHDAYFIAVDASGNLYTAQDADHDIIEIPANGSAYFHKGSGFSHPGGIAVDAAGNIYVGDRGNHAIKKIPANGSAIVTVASGFNDPSGIAVDAAGNLYVADRADNLVKKIPAGGGAVVTIASGLNYPLGIAVDVAGNVYVADAENRAIKKLPAGGGAISTLFQGTGYINGVATDAAGNVYFTNSGSNFLMMIPVTGGVVAVGAYVGNPYGICVDLANNIYVNDLSLSQGVQAIIEKEIPGGYYVTPVLPSGLSLDKNTGIISGTPTGGSPATDYTVIAFNNGGSGSAVVNLSSRPHGQLSGLTANTGTLSPVFAVDQQTYTLAEANSVAAIRLKPIASSPSDTIRINGVLVASGAVSQAIPLNIGKDTITVAVTGTAGETSIYTVIANRAGPPLTGLSISSGTLSPAFHSGTAAYTAQVSISVTAITVTPATSDGSTITVNGTAVATGMPSQSIPLAVGANVITIVVTNSGNFTNTYTVTVTRPGSSNAKLSHLAVNVGTLSPVFSPDSTQYNITAGIAESSITVTPVALEPHATIRVNDVAVASGTASAPIPLSAGNNYVPIVVIAQNGKSYKVYGINITRLSNTTMLTGLTVSAGALTPFFSPDSMNYKISVSHATTSITVKPTSLAGPTIRVNGTVVASNTNSSAIALAAGSNTITVAVTSNDGATTSNYSINVFRQGASDATLSGLTLSAGTLNPGFASARTSYTANESNTTTSITVTPTTNDPAATMTVNGLAVSSGSPSQSIPLNVGSNAITIATTSADGTTNGTYTVTVTRVGSANANLSKLSVLPGTLSPAFSPDINNYVVHETSNVGNVGIYATAAESNATITSNGPTTLQYGTSVVNIVVTAQNGVTTNTYTITETRARDNNPNLYSLALSEGTLSPTFDGGTTSYTATVGSGTSSMTVTPTTTNPNATITVNGATVHTGAVSQSIALSTGDNTITIVTHSPDNTATRTYTLTVTRPMAGDNTVYQPVGVERPVEEAKMEADGITVHQGISPNGDGMNDHLQIDGISKYPDNKITIMDRNGLSVYEAKGYDNSTKVFNGRSDKTGKMQQAGTYFYSLDYKVRGTIRHKTGFIVLKY